MADAAGEHTTMAKVLRLWSPQFNWLSLTRQPAQRRETRPLDAFRVFGCLWVILQHATLFYAGALNLTGNGYVPEMATLGYYVAFNGGLGVDIFFCVSGYLVMSILLHELADARTPAAFLTASAAFLLRRVLRLLPAMGVALGVWYAVASMAAAQGSAVGAQQMELCDQYWWANLLFVNNLLLGENGCMGWTWTVGAEMQMYIVSPLLVGAVLRWPRRGTVILAATIAASLATYIVLGYYLLGVVGDNGSLFNPIVYDKPYTRFFGYALGMAAAHRVSRELAQEIADRDSESALLAEYGATRRPRWLVVYLPRVLASLVAFAVSVFVQPSQTMGVPYSPWQLTCLLLQRPMFAVAIAYVVYDLCSPRCAGDSYHHAAARLLGCNVVHFFASLTYSIYLFHLIFIVVFYMLILAPLVVQGSLVPQPSWVIPTTTLTTFFVCCLPALAVFFLIEKPTINGGALLRRKP